MEVKDVYFVQTSICFPVIPLANCSLDGPDAVEDVAVWEDPDVEVGGEDVVELPDLLVPEESVWHPDLADVRQGEILDLLCNEGRYREEREEVRPHLSGDLSTCA